MSAKLGTLLLCLVSVFVLLFAHLTDIKASNYTTPSYAIETEAITTTEVTTPLPVTSEPTATTTVTEPITTAPPETTEEETAVPETTEEEPAVSETTDPAITEPPAVSDEPNDTTERKLVAFTFDDGPHGTLTYRFVDKLKEYNATATFFVVGNRVAGKAGQALRYAYDNGCEIGLHSWRHAYFANMENEEFQEDIRLNVEAVTKYIPDEITLLRPPGGKISAERRESLPYSIILWSVDPHDYLYRDRTDEEQITANINTIADHILSHVRPGDIVLMHEIYENSYEAFCIIIEEFYSQGYEIVTVSELLGDRLQSGQTYRHAR